jgi:hypothetical protein
MPTADPRPIALTAQAGATAHLAAARLARFLATRVEPAAAVDQSACILMIAAPAAAALFTAEISQVQHPEAYAIEWSPRGTARIVGRSEPALLYAVSDLIHHDQQRLHTRFSRCDKPALSTRGLWSWTRGIADINAYIERMSWWKLNTLTLWNNVPPQQADDIQARCDTHGIQLYWGFSWGWDYPDCTTEQQQMLDALLAKFPNNGQLPCPCRPESRQFIREYVLDQFERHYAPINAKAVYFQTFTEQPPCPCAQCSATSTGKLMLQWVQPIIEALLDRYPKLRLAAGVHNTMEDFEALRDLDSRCAIHWEREQPPNQAYPASSIQKARALTRLREANERFAFLIRLYGAFGLSIQTPVDPALAAAIQRNWKAIETGTGQIEHADVHNIGFHPEDGCWLNNPKMRELKDWIDAAKAPDAVEAGVVGLLEGSMWSIQPRKLPALFAELAWHAGDSIEDVEEALQRTVAAVDSEKSDIDSDAGSQSAG